MTVFEVLLKRLDDALQVRSEALTQGAPADYAAYKELCGVIQGLSIAKREISDLAKRQQELDDE